MSNKLDERITRIRFDNDQFERGVATSMQSLDRLKNKLESTESVDAFSGITKSAEKTDLSGIERAIDSVGDKFSALRMIAINVLSDIATQAISTGVALVKNLSTDNIAAGWGKYDQELQAVQTIMVTLDDTPLEEVEKSLKKIGWFSDETSYSYEEMVGSMSKLISSGVSLDDATNAVIGLSNAAAAAGVSTKKAQQAFYNFSQAFGAGYMQLQDWRSIELLNMATPEFKKNIIQTAVSLGKLVQVGEDLYSTSDNLNKPDSWFSTNAMRGSLKDKWFDQEVMNKVLGMYSEFADQVYEMQDAWDMDTASETMDKLEEMGIAINNVSNKAFRAAQEAKTFAEAIDSVKDAVSTKWKDTFKALFGNYEDAKGLWTDLANELYDLFAASGDVRNEILDQWNDPLSFMVPDEKVRRAYKFPEIQAGRDILVEGLWNIFHSIVNVVDAIKEAWREVFPQITAKKLYDLTKRFRDFTEKIKNSTENLEGFKRFLVEIFSVVRGVLNIGKKFLGFLKQLWPVVKKIWNIVQVVAEQVWQFFKDAKNYIKGSEKFGSAFGKLEGIFNRVKNAILNFDESTIHLPTFEDFLSIISKIRTALAGFKDKISSIYNWIKEHFKGSLIKRIIDGIIWSVTHLKEAIQNLSIAIKPILGNIASFFVDTWTTISTIVGKIGNAVKTVAQWIAKQFEGIDLRDILGTVVLASMSWFSIRLGIMVGRIGGILESLSDLIYSIGKVLNATAFKIRMDALRDLSYGILAIAGAIFIISKVDDPDAYNRAVWAVTNIAITLVGLSGIMAMVEKHFSGKSGGLAVTWSKDGFKLNGSAQRKGIVGLVVGVLGMILAVKFIIDMINSENVTSEQINRIIMIVRGVAFGLVVCAGLMNILMGVSQKIGGDKFRTSTFAPVALASAMLVMIRVFERLDTMELQHVGKVMAGMVAIIGSLALLSLALKRINAGTGIGMIGIVASLYLALLTLQKLSELDIDLRGKGPILAVLAGLLLVLGLIDILGKRGGKVLKKGEKFKQTTGGIISVILGLIACVGAIYLLSKIPREQLIQGGIAALAIIAVLFLGMMFTIMAANKAGKYAGRGIIAITALLIVATLMYALVSVIAYLQGDEWWKSITIMGVLLGGIAGICAALNRKEFKANTKSIFAVSAIIIGIGGIITALYFFSKSDREAAMVAVGGLAVLMVALGVMIKQITKSTTATTTGEAFQVIVLVGGLLAEIGVVIALLNSSIEHPDIAIASAIAMGVLAVAIGGAVRMINGIPVLNTWKTIIQNIVTFGAVTGIIGGVIIAMSKWVNGENLGWLSEYGNELLVAIGTLVALCVIIGGIGKILDVKTVTQGLLIFAEVTGGLILIAAAIFSIDTLIREITKDDFGYEEFRERLKNLPELTRDIGATIGGLYEGLVFGNLPDIAAKLSEFSDNLKPFIDNISNVPDGFFGKMTAVFGSLIEFLGTGLLTLLLNSPLGEELTIRKLKKMGRIFDSDGLFAAIRNFGSLDGIDDGIELLEKIGPAVKSFMQIDHDKLKKFDDEVFGELAIFTSKLIRFGDGLKNGVTDDTINRVGWVNRILGGIAASIKNFYNEYGGVLDLESIGTEIESLGESIGVYISNTSSITEDDVSRTELVSEIIGKLLTLNETVGINRGVQSWFEGWTDLGKFGTELGGFVKDGLAVYLSAMDTLTIDYLKECFAKTPYIVKMIKQIAGLNKVIGVNSGFVSWFESTDYETFGDQLGGLARGIVNYIAELAVTKDQAEYAADITNTIANSLNNLSAFTPEKVTNFNIALTDLANKGITAFTEAFSTTAVNEKMNSAIQALLGVFGKAVEWASYNAQYIAELVKPLIDAILEAISGFATDMHDKGKEFYGEFVNGMSEAKDAATETINGLAEDASNAWENVVKGGAKGIEKAEGVLVDAAEEAQEAYRKAMLSYWDINSPSRVAEKDYYQIGLGGARGIIESMPAIIGSIQLLNRETEENLLDGVIGTVSNVFNNITGTWSNVKGSISEFVTGLLGGILPEGTLNDIVKFLSGKFEGVLGELTPESLLEGIQEYMDEFGGFDLESNWNMLDYLNFDSMMAEFQDIMDDAFSGLSYDVGINPVLDDTSDITDYSKMLSGSYGGTVAGYSAEDVQNLTKEIYHLEDALYSLKNAMQDQKVVHSGELTIRYSNESDFIDRIQTAVIDNIRRGIRS